MVDTNVWVDSYCGWHPGWDDARKLIQLAPKRHVALLFPVHCAKDVLYITANELKRKTIREKGSLDEHTARAARVTALACMRNMSRVATPIGADASDLWLADKYLRLHEDFGDDLVLAACKRAGADYLVTTDKGLLQHADIAAKTPAQMVQILELLT